MVGRANLAVGVISVLAGIGIVVAGTYSGFGLVALGAFRLIRAYLAYAEEKEIDHRG